MKTLLLVSIIVIVAVSVISISLLYNQEVTTFPGVMTGEKKQSEQPDIEYLPTAQELNVTKLTFEKSCTKDMVCYGVFDNETKVRISCDGIVIHSCGVMSFDKPEINAKSVSRINTDQYLLEILNLQGNYVSDKEIRFDVHEKGFGVRCFSIYAEIYDSSGNKVWEQPNVVECPPGLGKSNFDNVIPFSGIKIGKTGEYRLVVQSRGYEIADTFSMIDQNLAR